MWFSASSSKPNATAASDEELKTLPGFFPASTRQCAKVSQEFFDCFSLQAVKTSDSDIDAGDRGLKACQKELKAYKSCMETCFEQKKELQQKRFRVSRFHFIVNVKLNMVSRYL